MEEGQGKEEEKRHYVYKWRKKPSFGWNRIDNKLDGISLHRAS